MDKYKDILSIGTTFNKRIYDSEYQKIFADMRDNYPYINFYVYHENSFEMSKYNQEIDFSNEERNNLHLFDVFKVNEDWIEDFLKTSPLKDCHKMGSRGGFDDQYFNRNAIYWFRKIAAMHRALDISKEKGYERIVFIDSDVVFKKSITDEFLDKIFSNAGFFFHLGKHRKRIGTGIESGFIGFSNDNRGFEFLQIVIDSFTSGDYRKYDRWDDGYVFRKIWEEHPEIPSKDVVGPHQLKPFSHVVRYGIFAKYLEHDKGSHTRRYGIFTDSTRI